MKSKLSSPTLHTAVGLALAVGLLYLFFRGTDTAGLAASIADARYSLLAMALVATLSSYLLRAARWRVLLSPLGRPSLGNCFETTVIGFMVNFLVPPGRLGEIARPYLLARREGFSASSAFATIFLERILDLVTVVFFVGAGLVVRPPAAVDEAVVRGLKLGGVLGLAGAALTLVVLFAFARRPEVWLARVGKILRLLPGRAEAALLRFVETFSRGLGVLVDAGSLVKAAAWSVLLWLNVCLAFWFGARALAVSFSYIETFLVIGFLTVGVAVPTPGAVGGYHVMCALALGMLFGTEESLAKAVALVNHAIAFLPIALLGIVLFVRAGLSFQKVKTLTETSNGREVETNRKEDEP